MDRKKFVALFSTGIVGIVLLKANSIHQFLPKFISKNKDDVKVKLNPDAVKREKSGKKYG